MLFVARKALPVLMPLAAALDAVLRAPDAKLSAVLTALLAILFPAALFVARNEEPADSAAVAMLRPVLTALEATLRPDAMMLFCA